MEQKNQHLPFDLLADYVEGLLDPERAREIQARVEKDEYYRHVVEGIKHYFATYGEDREGLEKYLQDFQQRLARRHLPQSYIRKLNSGLTRIAAALLLLLGVGWLLRGYLGGPDTDSLISSALDTPYGNVYVLSKSENPDSIRSRIGDLYQRGQYREVSQVLEAFVQRRPEDTEIRDQLMLALAYLYQDPPRPERARDLLEEAYHQNDAAAWEQQLSWYLALARYQSGDREHALSLLARIATDSGHYQRAAAQKILNSLDN